MRPLGEHTELELLVYTALLSGNTPPPPPDLYHFSHFIGVEFVTASNKKEDQLKQECHIYMDGFWYGLLTHFCSLAPHFLRELKTLLTSSTVVPWLYHRAALAANIHIQITSSP